MSGLSFHVAANRGRIEAGAGIARIVSLVISPGYSELLCFPVGQGFSEKLRVNLKAESRAFIMSGRKPVNGFLGRGDHPSAEVKGKVFAPNGSCGAL